jgi:hypothetical protein
MGAEAADSNAAGSVVAKGSTCETVATTGGLRIWAAKAGDPFWIEPDVLHAVGHAFQNGATIDLSGWNPSRAKNLFAGHTVYSIVLEAPDTELLAASQAISASACGRSLRSPPTPAAGAASSALACR